MLFILWSISRGQGDFIVSKITTLRIAERFINHLRYFVVQTGVDSVPSSINNLWNLQTFLVRGIGGRVLLPYFLEAGKVETCTH